LAKIVIFSQLAKDLKIENRKVLKIMLPLVKKSMGLFSKRAHPLTEKGAPFLLIS